jgi:histidinol-phosphate aminotransferase
LAGLRLGYGYATPAIASYLRILCKPFLLSTLAIQAGMAALGDLDFVAHSVASNREQKRYLYHQFGILGIKYWPTQANFILIKPPLNPLLFEKKMLDLGIMVRPVDNFGATGCIRITIGRPDQNVKLVSAISKVLKQLSLKISTVTLQC